ncbi:MAG TPA: ABC transporter ATP-binding protein [Candidatus Limnocylindrales bacterium]|nr:ABC transporter ATP-binding protein [Candidatus Limnocylindrales bacterium]
MDDAPLVAEGFGRRYRRNRPWACRDVSLAVPAGSITALVGPNGAGKSTLIRACIGFERPDEGRVLVNGIDPRRDRTRAVESVGYVPQGAVLYRNLTIDDHLDLARVSRPVFDRPYASQRIAAVGLGGHRRVGDLSGGEQAQVALALALGTRAPLLILDEPMANLDPLARRDFLTVLVEEVRSRGTTALLSSHIVTDVEQACDRLVVLSGGRLLLDVAVADAREQHRTLDAAELDGRAVVGMFAGQRGEPLALVRDRSIGREATLEEIVLGYLAAARSTLTAEAA